MKFSTTVRALIAGSALTTSLLGATLAPAVIPVAQAGPCLFGHVDPKDDNSACRGSDAARWPESEQTADGSPALTCSRLNDGAHVRTHDGLGWRYWLCKRYKDSWGHTYYEWTEVLGQ
jgi:predicted lipoprotein with Yx(FWY)xxD motif